MQEAKQVFIIRRIIFLLVAIAVAIPLIAKMRMQMVVSPLASNLYEAVKNAPADKIVVVSANWDAGTVAENGPQTTALIYQLAKEHKRFAIWGWAYPSGPELAQGIVEPIAKQYHLKYGTDWINWGYTTGADPMVRGWAKDIKSTLKTDMTKKPLEQWPIMKGINSAKDVGIVVEFASSASIGSYISYVKGVYGTPIGYACTGVMVPEAFPFLDSKQLVGLMRGLVGAAEYETLAGVPKDEAIASMRMSSQSFAHLLIILLIIIGNTGYYLNRRRQRRAAEGQSS
jgi:hypothetical protein